MIRGKGMVWSAGADGAAAIALERLCEQLAEARVLADEGGELPALEGILARLQADSGDLEQFTDDADDLLRRCGAAQGLGGRRDAGPGAGWGSDHQLAHLGGGHPVEEIYACPAARCARVLLATETTGQPVCEIFDRPLPLKRL
jgi:hypothetical protein